MLRKIARLYQWTNRHSGKFFLLGLVGVSIYNLHQWKRDGNFFRPKPNPDLLPPLETWPYQPKVSVLVAAWNESAFIRQHIESYLCLRYPNKELIICAGGDDDTYPIAQRAATKDVILMQQRPGQGKQRALSECFKKCSGEIIYLTDADCLLDDKSFERVIYPIACGEVNACSGGSLPLENSLDQPLVVLQAASDFFQYTNPKGPKFFQGLLGRNCALNKKTIQTAGSFSSHASSGTDYLLAKQISRKNIRIKQVRNSLVRSDYPRKPNDYIMQKRRWHRNVILIGIKYRNLSETARAVGLSMLSLFMLAAPIFVLVGGLLWFYLWILIFFFGFLSRMRYLQVWRINSRKPSSIHPGTVLFSLILDFIAWSLGFIEIFFPQRRIRW
jgi:cellulose synthase/poly-beta-1,6-N-acetylglucosamine synthase-like glycosyltransferase